MEERDGDPSFDGDASIGVVFPLDCEALAEREERDASSAPPPPISPRSSAIWREDKDSHGFREHALGVARP